MSEAQIVFMSDKLTESLLGLCGLLARFAVLVPSPEETHTVDFWFYQKALVRGQRIVESPRYAREYGINPATRGTLVGAIHEWLCAVDEYQLMRNHGAMPWRVDQFDVHMTLVESLVMMAHEDANAGIAWARREE